VRRKKGKERKKRVGEQFKKRRGLGIRFLKTIVQNSQAGLAGLEGHTLAVEKSGDRGVEATPGGEHRD
jgi:hypothetical protein